MGIQIKKMKTKFILFLIINITLNLQSQTVSKIDYSNPKTYKIEAIRVSGIQNLNAEAIITISALKVGQKIKVTGKEITTAISKLWEQKIFSDINITIDKIDKNLIYLNIELKEYHRLSKFNFKGKISKSDISTLKEDLQLIRGKVLSKNLINNSINSIKKYYIEKGFYTVDVDYLTITDTTTTNAKILTFKINKGKKIKINDIIITGRKKIANPKKTFFNRKDTIYALSNRAIRKSMKETKRKNPWRIFKVSKFISKNYENDKQNIIAKYNEIGYRDARIISDSVYLNKDNTLSVKINITEGETYKFGDISFIGNKIHTNEELQKQLAIKKGDIFDQSILDARIFGSPDGNDVSSMYLDNGYLFFNATPIEIAANNRIIDLEIKIYEGDQARVNKVFIKGNTKTNDHVIRRELRTFPGEPFKRSDIIRSQRELAQMQYFDPEAFDVKIEPNPSRNEVDITYILEEKSSDQIQLQGGWGAGNIVGSLGLTFSNFSTRNIFKKEKWTPLPSGDGQRLSLTATANAYYQNYNISFTEPWLGGKNPNSLTTSLYKSISNYNNDRVEITGLTIGLGKRMKFPDDYFTIYNAINLQKYDITTSNEDGTSYYNFSGGDANNINYTIKLGRNSVDQLIYPRRGSNLSLTLKLSPPYSMFDGIENYSKIPDNEKYEFIEYYKWKFKSTWFSSFTEKLVLATRMEFGFLGAYNDNLGVPPFERFYVGGDGMTGMMGYVFDGREIVALRGYQNNKVSSPQGATIYNKYTTELRYGISLNPASTVYALGFLEAGNAWDDFDSFNPFGVKRSAGIGLRISLPMIGIMGLDYAWGLDVLPNWPDANGGQFHFSINQEF